CSRRPGRRPHSSWPPRSHWRRSWPSASSRANRHTGAGAIGTGRTVGEFGRQKIADVQNTLSIQAGADMTEHDILAIVDRFWAARVAGDTAGVQALLAPG